MPDAEHAPQGTKPRKATTPPKGRPTPGRRQRNAAARARAKHQRNVVRLWWAAGILVVGGALVAIVLTGS